MLPLAPEEHQAAGGQKPTSMLLASPVHPHLHSCLHLQGPKPAPQQAMTERQVADARAANAAVEAAEAAAVSGDASGSGSAAQPEAVPVAPRV